ncbi:MAG: hypothetical protein QNK87_03850, partial [Octadecabacter sp.]
MEVILALILMFGLGAFFDTGSDDLSDDRIDPKEPVDPDTPSWAQMAMIQSCWAAVQMFMMAVLAMTASMAAQASTPYQGVTLAMSS